FVGCRDSAGKNCDLPAGPAVTLQPGQRYDYRQSSAALVAGNVTVWPAIFVSGFWIELGPRRTFEVAGAPDTGLDYSYVPPPQRVSGGGTTYFDVAGGLIHQTAWSQFGGSG